MDENSRALPGVIAGLVGLLLAPLGLFVGPVIIVCLGASIFAIYAGVSELGRISAGEVGEDKKLLAFGSIGLGGLGCLAQLGMFASIFGLVMLLALNS